MEKNMKRITLLNHFAVHQKLTQHCKSTVLQLEKPMWLGWFCWYLQCHLQLWNEIPKVFIVTGVDGRATRGERRRGFLPRLETV